MVNNTFPYYKMNDFWVEKFVTPRKKKFGAKKGLYQKKIQLDFSSKIEVPSLARLGSETFQLGSALEISARTHHYRLCIHLRNSAQKFIPT